MKNNNIKALLILGILPFLAGLIPELTHPDIFFAEYDLTNLEKAIFNFALEMGFVLGGIAGAFVTDLGDRKKWIRGACWFIIFINVAIQFDISYPTAMSHRALNAMTVAFITILSMTHLTEILIPKHRGKALITFYALSSLGVGLGKYISFYINKREELLEFGYGELQIPIIIFTLLVIAFLNTIPFNHQRQFGQSIKFKTLFSKKLRSVLFVLFVCACVTNFTYGGLVSQYINIISISGRVVFLLNGIIGFIGALIGILAIDLFGRKRMLQIGSIGIALTSLGLFIAVLFDMNATDLQVLMYIYLLINSLSYSSVIQVLILEYLPTKIRGRGLLVYNMMSYVLTFIFMISIAEMTEMLFGNLLYLIPLVIVVNIFALWFFTKKLVETKGLTLDRIEKKVIN